MCKYFFFNAINFVENKFNQVKSEYHFINRSGWLRASVLGVNDGIISTTSLAIGVAAASLAREPIILATLAGLVAGALSMAAGEYVSVSSQVDIETADLKREKYALTFEPEVELIELSSIYENRGLTSETARVVANQLTAHNALDAHARDELGIHELTRARPLQAAVVSAASFLAGGILPLLIAVFAPINHIIILFYAFSIPFLALSGTFAAKAGGSKISKSVLRICTWGTIVMILSALIGYLFGVSIH